MIIDKVSISLENRKLGPIPSVSFHPGLSCGRGCGKLLCTRDCYAIKMLRYTRVGEGWAQNFRVWQRSPRAFFNAIRTFLREYEPRRFRWNVGGDVPSQVCLDRMHELADDFPGTEFLAFTKAYRFLDATKPPTNSTVVVSRWPGMDLPKSMSEDWLGSTHTQAWMKPNDYGQQDFLQSKYAIPTTANQCPGSCLTCKKCWGLKPGQSVVFDQH